MAPAGTMVLAPTLPAKMFLPTHSDLSRVVHHEETGLICDYCGDECWIAIAPPGLLRARSHRWKLIFAVASLVVALGAAAYFLSGALPVPFLPAQTNCSAWDEDSCLARPGCHWFQRAPVDCPLCDRWFGSQASVTGCRDWDLDTYCSETIALAAASKGFDLRSPEVRSATQSYEIVMGRMEWENPMRKRFVCNIWCDFGPFGMCSGQPKVHPQDEVRGVNYGGRFIPERYLQLPGTAELFQGVSPPARVLGRPVADVSLCDVGATPDAAERFSDFLGTSIREDHFERMADLGFNTVRLPLGYWNLLNASEFLEGPRRAPVDIAARVDAMERILPPAAYRGWIDDIFAHARRHGLRVLLDFHAAPGGQTANVFTGCDQGIGNVFFDTPWNKALALRALGVLAELCASHGRTCYGIELLNEPAGTQGPSYLQAGDLDRRALLDFYKLAIQEVRQHVPQDMPVVINEWPAWLPWWMDQEPLTYREYGRIAFSSHLYYYGPYLQEQEAARHNHEHDLQLLRRFFMTTRYDVMVTEYGMSGHGSGSPQSDVFEYNRFANWFVNELNRYGVGSMVWNFDSASCAWGPVAARRVGRDVIEWKEIFDGSPGQPHELHF